MNFLHNPIIDFFYFPLLKALIFLYQILPIKDFGIALLIFTILIKLILSPLSFKAIKSQKSLSQIQSKVKEIQEKHKEDKEKQMKAILELYKKEKFNPFSGCLFSILQIPIFLALFRLFWEGVQSFDFEPLFLGKINLSLSFFIQKDPQTIQYYWPAFFLAFLATAFQFIQFKMQPFSFSQQKKDQMSKILDIFQKEMIILFPLFTLLVLLKLPCALSLYWLSSTLFSIFQQKLIFKTN